MVKKFKVGDKVKVVRITKAPDDDTPMEISSYTHHLGNVYTIEHIRDEDIMYPIQVEEDIVVWRHEDFEYAIVKNKIGGKLL